MARPARILASLEPPAGLRTPAARFALGGFAAGWIAVLGQGRVRPIPGTRPPSGWLGMLHSAGASQWIGGFAEIFGIAAVVVLWLLLMRQAALSPSAWPLRRLWGIAGAWTVPFTVGPPMLSSDVYSYAAQGILVRAGLNPYTDSPSTLGLDHPATQAVDPMWRGVHSPYGPLATLVEHLGAVATGGSAVGVVVAMRVVAVVSVFLISVFAVDLAAPDRKRWALFLTGLNPMVLIHLVSASHLDALMIALVLAAVVAERHGHVEWAIVLGCAAGAIKVPGMLVAAAVVFATWHPSQRSSNLRVLGGGAIALVAWLGLSLITPHGWGWISALKTPGLGHTPLAPATMIANLLDKIIPVASFDDLAYAGRIVATGVGLALIAYLLLTARHRSVVVTTGLALFAMMVTSPVVYPWYLTWGALVLAPAVDRRARDWLIGLSMFASTTIILGMPWVPTIIWAVLCQGAVIGFLVWAEMAAARRKPHWTAV